MLSLLAFQDVCMMMLRLQMNLPIHLLFQEKEVEEWAAGFNSMCEDIEEFDLVVE